MEFEEATEMLDRQDQQDLKGAQTKCRAKAALHQELLKQAHAKSREIQIGILAKAKPKAKAKALAVRATPWGPR
eukprot:13454065-Heterocapsa_arctica.AAC.1